MTIPARPTGDTIDETWTDAVTDQLNDLPEFVQEGSSTVTHTSGNSETITFPVAFASSPIITVTVVAIGTGTEWAYAVRALSATSFQMRLYANGTAYGATMTYHWRASGVRA